MNIYLIGYRGAGKSSVGKILAANLGMKFADTDLEIVKRSKRSVSEIVEKSGWDEFREIEKKIIREISSLERYVVAAGGGSVLDDGNVRHMKKTGIVVWLRAEPGTISERMIKDIGTDKFRPALTAKGTFGEIDEILASREPFYEKAMDYFIDTDKRDISDVCHDIMNMFDTTKEKQ